MADIVTLFPEETQVALRDVLSSLTAEERESLKGKMDGLRVEERQFSRESIAEALVGFLKEIQDTRLRSGSNSHGFDVQV